VNALLSCLLLNNTPNELRMILVDPKRVELTGYNGVPHLLAPVVVEAEQVVGALQWVQREMDARYHRFSQVGARNIVDYNGKNSPALPYMLVLIDELADLMMLAPDETERHSPAWPSWRAPPAFTWCWLPNVPPWTWSPA
ncbi:MAG: hypothetical protein EHM21_19545, partial [Chloroflexi bacterium]